MNRTTNFLIAMAVLAAAGLLPFSTLAHEAHGHFSAGEPGDPKKPARIVKVKMLEEGRRCCSNRP